MKKQDLNRKYNITDADFYVRCMETARYASRDIDEFKKHGYAAEKVTGFIAQCEKFRNMPDDDEMVGDQMIVTEKKYDAAEKLKNAIRSIMTRVEMKYGNRSGRYRKFGSAKMGDMTDAQLLFCARRVARVARQQMDFFEDVGLSEKTVARVLDASVIFENAMNIQQDRIADRDISVEVRVEVGNKIYDEWVKICNIGKDIWLESNPQKYEQYCIYESNNDQKIARKQRLANEADDETTKD